MILVVGLFNIIFLQSLYHFPLQKGKNTEDQAHGLNINMTPDINAQLPAKDSQSPCEVIVQGMPFYCCWITSNKILFKFRIIMITQY